MINNNYILRFTDCCCRIPADCECNVAVAKTRMDLPLLFLHRQGLAGRSSAEARPTCRLQGSNPRSGRFPALPYPPLEQMGLLPPLSLSVFKGSVSRFRFPGGL